MRSLFSGVTTASGPGAVFAENAFLTLSIADFSLFASSADFDGFFLFSTGGFSSVALSIAFSTVGLSTASSDAS